MSFLFVKYIYSDRSRNAIAEVINATNEKAGIAERVDPRSYKDRGIPLIPTIHLGERASALERKGIRTERDNINRAIEKYNAMIMKIYGFISEIKEELKKGVFKFVFERKSRTEKDGIQSINPSINASVPEQKPEVQTALEMLQKQRSVDSIGQGLGLENIPEIELVDREDNCSGYYSERGNYISINVNYWDDYEDIKYAIFSIGNKV